MSGPSRTVKITLLGDDKASNAIGKVGGAATGLMTKVAKLGAIFGGTALVAGVYKLGATYTSALNNMQAATGATDRQMQAVRKTARALGADTTLAATSAADAAQAMTELAKGGLKVDQAMAAAKGTLQLAAAAQIDAAAAATIQVNALNQFGLAADQAGHVADVLANTANAASGEITDMANALSYVGPVAKAMGISIDDTATSIGMLAQNGILGDKAGTALRGMLASLAAPSKGAKNAMKALGIEAFDTSGKFIGMRSITDQLAAAHGRMTDKQFQANAAMAFGREPLAALNALAAGGAPAFDAMAKAVGRQGGAADVAAAKTKGLKGAFEGLRSQAETIGIGIYEKVAGPLENAVRGLTTGVGDFAAGWSNLGKTVDGQTTLLSQAGGKAAEVGGKVGNVGRDIAKSLIESVPIVGAAAATLFDAIADSRLADKLRIDLGPMVTQLRTDAAKAGRDLFDGVKDGLQHGDWTGLGETLGQLLTGSLKNINKVFNKAIEVIGQVDWMKYGIAAGKKAPEFLTGIALGFLNADWAGLIVKLGAHWKLVLFAILTVGLAPEALLGKVALLLERIPLIGPLVNWAFKHFAAFSGKIVGWILEGLGKLGGAFMRGLAPQAPRLIAALRRLGGDALAWLQMWAEELAKRAGGAMLKLAEALGRGVGSAFRNMRAAAADAARGFAESMSELLVAAGRAVVNGFIRGITSMFGAVKSKLGQLTKLLPDWKGPADLDSVLLYESGQLIIGGLIDGMSSRFVDVQRLLGTLTDGIPGMVTGGDLAAAQARANESPVAKAERARDDAFAGVGPVKDEQDRLVAAQQALVTAADRTVAAQKRVSGALAATAKAAAAASAAQARHVAQLVAATKAADDEGHALHRAAQQAAARAAGMPAQTAAQKRAKDATEAHARALLEEARQADDTERRLRQQLTAARETAAAAAKKAGAAATAATAASKKLQDAQEAAAEASKALGEAVTEANAKVAEANQRLIEAQAALADAVYADQLSQAQGFASQATSMLDEIAGKAAALRDAFSQSVTAGTGLADLFKSEGDEASVTLDQVLEQLRGTLSGAQAFSEQLGALAGAGLSEQLLQQVAAAGPKLGAQMAGAILAAGPDGIKALNDLTEQISQVAVTGMDSIVDKLYAPGAAALQSYVEGLRSVFPELDAVLTQVQQTVAQILGARAEALALTAIPIETATPAAAAAQPTDLQLFGGSTAGGAGGYEQLLEEVRGLREEAAASREATEGMTGAYRSETDRRVRLSRSGALV